MKLPRVKPEHQPYRRDSRTVRIGGDVYGLATEIHDPQGCAWYALRLMDGTRSVQEIADLVGARFPGQEDVVETLLAAGHVEDAAAVPPAELSTRELDRYTRNADYFRWADLAPREHGWEPQLRLKQARVLILGLGGTGTHAAWALAAAGVGHLHCVDADRVELSNLNRQMLYGGADLGRHKAAVAVARLRDTNTDITVTGENRRITSRQELTELAEGFDVLALCADEPRGGDGIRAWANRAGLPWVGGGYAGPRVSVGVFAPGHPCWECLRAEGERRGQRTDFGFPGVISTSAGLSGLLTAQGVVSLLTGIPDIPPGYVVGLNLVSPDDRVFTRFPSRADCAVCGQATTLTDSM